MAALAEMCLESSLNRMTRLGDRFDIKVNGVSYGIKKDVNFGKFYA